MPDLQQWRKANSDDFSLWDYLFAVANVEVALVLYKTIQFERYRSSKLTARRTNLGEM